MRRIWMLVLLAAVPLLATCGSVNDNPPGDDVDAPTASSDCSWDDSSWDGCNWQ